METKVLNIKGEDTGRTVKLQDNWFGIQPNDHVIYLDVKRYMKHQRQGTAKAKERSEVSGSGTKIKRQKGTGTARAGSRKNPMFRSGGTAFGPRPKDYSIKINKKVKQLARKSALSYKAQDNQIMIVEDFTLDAPKTKEMVSIKNNLQISDKKLLIVLQNHDKNIYLSSRNLQGVKVVSVSDLNTYDILNNHILVFDESSINHLQNNN